MEGAVCSMKLASWRCFAQGCSVWSSSACGHVVGQAAGIRRKVWGTLPPRELQVWGCAGGNEQFRAGLEGDDVQEAMNRSGLGRRVMEGLIGPACICSPGLHHFMWAPHAKKVLEVLE